MPVVSQGLDMLSIPSDTFRLAPPPHPPAPSLLVEQDLVFLERPRTEAYL